MLFPNKATEYEKGIDWYKITEIKDVDFGFNTPKEKNKYHKIWRKGFVT